MSFFKTTAEIRAFINVDLNMKFDKLKPSIQDAAIRWIKPLLGESFFLEMATAYDAGTLTTDQQDLLPYIQKAQAFYTAYLMVDEIGVQVGDLGVQQQFSQNSQPAPAWKVAKLTMKYITSADSAADHLLEYLEKVSSASKFGTWFSDMEANTAMSGVIVHKTSIASQYIDINNSRRIFLKLKKRIRDFENSYIRSLVCEDQYRELVAQLQTGSVTEKNKKLIAHLEPIIAKQSFYMTITFLAISVEAEGIFLYSSNDTVIQKQLASPEEKDRLQRALKEGPFGFDADEAELAKFLNQNITDYPLISASPCWTNRPADGEYRHRVENCKWNKHFST